MVGTEVPVSPPEVDPVRFDVPGCCGNDVEDGDPWMKLRIVGDAG